MSGRLVAALLFFLAAMTTGLPFANAAGPVHGAKSAGLGTAFAALADDPSAMAANPAGIGFLTGTRLYQGLTAVTIDTRYRDDAGYREETDDQMFYVPHLYISSQLQQSDWTLGLGLFSPFGIGGREWPSEGRTRYLSTESLVATGEVNPTIAWRPWPSLSIAAGLVYLWSSNEMQRRIDQSPFGPDGTLEFEGDGDGLGWNAGLLWLATDHLRLGLAYRSPVEVDIDGELEVDRITPALQPLFGGSRYKADASTCVEFPPIITVGLAWLPWPSLTITTEVEWVGWSTFDRQRILLDDSSAPMGLRPMVIDLDWKDSWIYKIGVQYGINENLDVRLGYNFVESPVPESTLSPANPESCQHNISAGVGYRWGQLTLDAFYTIALYEDITVRNNLLDGTYRNQGHYFGTSLGWRF